MENETGGFEKTSAFSGGINQLYRLNDLWIEIHKKVRRGQLGEWNWELDRVWVELAGSLHPEKNKEDAKIEQKYLEFTAIIGDLKKQLQEKKIAPEEWRQQLYNTLMDKELFLRRIEDKQGKGAKTRDADEDDFED